MTEEDGEGAKSPRPFVFTCQMCGKSCRRDHIPVFLSDLGGWVGDGTIERVLPFLHLAHEEDELLLEIVKGESGHCALYHQPSRKCSIHYNKPLDCRAFPLGFEGERFFVRKKDCLGLGKGEMPAEALAAMRADAQRSFRESERTASVLPVLHLVVFQSLMESTRRAMSGLTENERKAIDEMMAKASMRMGKGTEEGDEEEIEIQLDGTEDKKDADSPKKADGPADGTDKE